MLEEGSERRAAFAQLRSRAHEIAVETVEKKSLSPFNDKVHGLNAHNSRPLGHWRNLEQLRMLGACASSGSLVMEFLVGPPPLGPAPALPLRLSRCWARLSEPEKKKDPEPSFSRFLENAYFDPPQLLKEMPQRPSGACRRGSWRSPPRGRTRTLPALRLL